MAAFLLVHGAFCQGWVWQEMATALQGDGHQVEMIDLPSSGTDAAQLGDLTADADVVRGALDTSGPGVVLVGHSGGGAVLTEVADHPSVVHSVYLAAFWPQRGQSVAEMLGGLPDWVAVRDDGAAEVSHDLDLVRRTLCADIDAETFAARVYPRYVLTSLASLGVPNTAPDRTHGTTYIITEQDMAVPPQAQEAMSAAADRVVRIPSSHSPMLSMTARLASLLGEAAAAA
jgi:pimeloyl-ACP methyl ester carboxylesterase